MQVCVIQDGNVVCDVAGGFMDRFEISGMQTNTLVPVFSVTKALTATAARVCFDKKLISSPAVKVRDIWEEF